MLGGNIFVRNNTDSAIYGTIAGANTIAGSTITADTQFSRSGYGVNEYPNKCICEWSNCCTQWWYGSDRIRRRVQYFMVNLTEELLHLEN